MPLVLASSMKQQYFILDAIMPAFVSSKCLSVQLLTPFTTRFRRNNPANIRMQEKRRLARHHQHKASLMEEELLLDNAVIPDAPPTQPPATQPPPESPSLQPPPKANRAARRLVIGDQQSAESTPQPALERSTSPAPSQDSWQDWPPCVGGPAIITTRRRLQHRAKTRPHSAAVSGIRGPTAAKGVPHRKGR